MWLSYRNIFTHTHIYYIYIYIIVEKSPNSSHMYDHGFMDNTNRQAVKNWLGSQTRDASITSWRQPFYRALTSSKFGCFYLIDLQNGCLHDVRDASLVCESSQFLTAWRLVLSMKPWSYIWLEFGLFSTIIAIIRACACWALFVVTLTNTVHLIYIYIFKHILVIEHTFLFSSPCHTLYHITVNYDIWCEIDLKWISLALTDDKSTLVQVMAWCHQATSHCLSQCWPLCHHMASLSHNKLRAEFMLCYDWL